MPFLEIVEDHLLAPVFGEPPIGALWAVKGDQDQLAHGWLMAPGGVAVSFDGTLNVTTGTLFGPGAGTVVHIQTLNGGRTTRRTPGHPGHRWSRLRRDVLHLRRAAPRDGTNPEHGHTDEAGRGGAYGVPALESSSKAIRMSGASVADGARDAVTVFGRELTDHHHRSSTTALMASHGRCQPVTEVADPRSTQPTPSVRAEQTQPYLGVCGTTISAAAAAAAAAPPPPAPLLLQLDLGSDVEGVDLVQQVDVRGRVTAGDVAQVAALPPPPPPPPEPPPTSQSLHQQEGPGSRAEAFVAEQDEAGDPRGG